MKKLLFSILIVFLMNINSADATTIVKKKVVVVTIPKSGTSMLEKIISLITDNSNFFAPTYQHYAHNYSDNYSGYVVHAFENHGNFKKENFDDFIKIVLIRDLRDVIISQINWIVEAKDWVWITPKTEIDRYCNRSFKERLLMVLDFSDQYGSIKYFANNAYLWMQDPLVYVCRFEDMIGREGGGSYLSQRKVIKELADHLGVSISERRIDEIISQIYGKSWTYRPGQKLAKWQILMDMEDLQSFYEKLGNEQYKLGYE